MFEFKEPTVKDRQGYVEIDELRKVNVSEINISLFIKLFGNDVKVNELLNMPDETTEFVDDVKSAYTRNKFDNYGEVIHTVLANGLSVDLEYSEDRRTITKKVENKEPIVDMLDENYLLIRSGDTLIKPLPTRHGYVSVVKNGDSEFVDAMYDYQRRLITTFSKDDQIVGDVITYDDENDIVTITGQNGVVKEVYEDGLFVRKIYETHNGPEVLFEIIQTLSSVVMAGKQGVATFEFATYDDDESLVQLLINRKMVGLFNKSIFDIDEQEDLPVLDDRLIEPGIVVDTENEPLESVTDEDDNDMVMRTEDTHKESNN